MEFTMRVPKLEDWYYAALARLYDEVPPRRDGILVMGCPVWGDQFIHEFAHWCVPSMMEPESAAALRRDGCRLVVCTTAADRPALLRAIAGLDRAGVELQFIEIPEEVIQLARESPQIKLFLLGTAQKLVLEAARRIGGGFNMLMPDHVHGAGYYARHAELRKKHDAIAQCGISAAREPAQADMEAFRLADLTLSVPPTKLGDIGWRHLHNHHRANIMAPAHPVSSTFPDAMPRTQLMLWRTRDRLIAHSCRPNPIWLSPALVAAIPTDLQRPATLDCEVPILAPQGCYLTTAEDGMVALELTAGDDKPADGTRVSFDQFNRRAWNEARYSDVYLDLLGRRTELPLTPDEAVGVTSEQVASDIRSVTDEMRARLPALTLELMRRIASAPETMGLTTDVR